ncbi:dihydroorotate dehydrogenase electron transfer subunit [Paenibacillus anaericanus]|uniref:Dihydroorotate dehydrogenase electron transfer subunit n=1 Tax=Paenibacillus anaericanus TaxID=170367 RepID=A0A3S1BRL7_9BACL|nr:dihydroorotate dehydrogenase electron transfer subunit [Paenibacillus anaericanus]RUT48052.1 dihydroorotate dehydrogenase electron transfer subunit [Paenibacillus anaericanus]
MSEVISNVQVAPNVYRLQVAGQFSGVMGQFYMLRSWEKYPLLSRPLSIFDLTEDKIEFLYLVTGEGTEMFSRLLPGDKLTLEGPFGNGFPEAKGKTAFIGGGIGIAPFYYALRTIPNADVFLGYSRDPYMIEAFQEATKGTVEVNIGGTVLDQVDFNAYDTIFTCGPHPMLQAVQRKQISSGTKANVYVSLENRMACGIGACLVCSVKCVDKRRKACTDGPVFRAEEVVLS